MATYTGNKGQQVTDKTKSIYGMPIWASGANSIGQTPTGTGPQSGSGAFGLVPGQIGVPDIAGDLAKHYPGMGETQDAVGRFIRSEAEGKLSPETMANIKNSAATYGVQTGIPGSQLGANFGLYNTALATQNLQRAGATDYEKLLPTIFETQVVNPELQTAIAQRNALYAAAPNPELMARYSKYVARHPVAYGVDAGGGFDIGNVLSGAIGGGTAGSAGGPWGALGGAVVGGTMGGLKKG